MISPENSNMLRPRTVFKLWLACAGLIAVLDQWTKSFVLEKLFVGEKVVVTPFFNLTLTFNDGAAFSFLATAGGWQRWFFIGLAAVVSLWIIYLLYKHRTQKELCIGLSLILGGALGNLVDRVNRGAVVDFIQVHAAGHYFPTFNVADSAITVGAILLIAGQLFAPKSTPGVENERSG